MKTDEMVMDYRLRRLATMNEIGDMRDESYDVATMGDRRKKKKKKSSSSGIFMLAGWWMLYRRSTDTQPGILSLNEVSDGHPMVELTPDFAWFRALTFNNITWTNLWPELTI